MNASMGAIEALTADVAALRRKAAEQEEELRALSKRVTALTDALEAAFRYAGVSYPQPPRRLQAVPVPGQGSRQ